MHYLLFPLLLVGVTAVRAQCTVSASGGDDAPALLRAVQNSACPTVTVPKGTTLSLQTKMDMRGLTNKHISLAGTLKFSDNMPYWTGNSFKIDYQNSSTFWYLGGTNVRLDGGGTIDGSGQAWWDAAVTNATLLRPITLTVASGNGVLVTNIKMINGPNWMNLIMDSKNVTYSSITITDVSTSVNTIRNTDGWDTYRSSDIVIKDSVIHNGDDCVSFKPNSTNIVISNLDCTGSHGISVGSLGQYPGIVDIVQNIFVENIKMTSASNGVRIKTWAGPNVGSGLVKNITYHNFWNSNVQLPVTIDQCYSTTAALCASNPSNTLIQDIFLKNVTGTASGTAVATLNCSPGNRCGTVQIDDLTVKPGSGTAKYTCQNMVVTGNSASLFGKCASTG